MAQPRNFKAYQAAWIAMEESFVILRAWLLPMARVTLDSSVRFALSDLILLTLLKVVAFVPQDTTVPERQPLHSNVRLAHLTMRLMQLNLRTVCHAHQGNTVRVMVTPILMGLVMKAGTVQGVHIQRNHFLM